MGSVAICDECHGAAAQPFDRGPVVERCTRCRGAGVLFTNHLTELQDLAALLGPRANEVFATTGEGGLVRALTVAAADLEQRVAAVEAQLARLV